MSRRVGMATEVKKSDEDKLLEGFMNSGSDGAKPPDEDKKSDGKEKK